MTESPPTAKVSSTSNKAAASLREEFFSPLFILTNWVNLQGRERHWSDWADAFYSLPPAGTSFPCVWRALRRKKSSSLAVESKFVRSIVLGICILLGCVKSHEWLL